LSEATRGTVSAAEPGEQDPTGPVGVSPVIGADGRPQAMAERCSTCILRPGGSSLVPADVVRDLVERHRRVGAVVTCHQTLADIPGSCPEIGYSACRGFLDAYPDTLAALISQHWLGGWRLITPSATNGH
jgi:hypothetical protein